MTSTSDYVPRLTEEEAADYEALRARAEEALVKERAPALEAAIYEHTDRLGELMGLPPIDWPAAQDALLSAHAGLRVVQ